MSKREIDPYFVAGVVVGAAVIVVYASSVWLHRQKVKRASSWPVAISETGNGAGLMHVYGDSDAPHVLREISDFRCTGCAHAETTVVEKAKKLADDKILRLIVYDLPGPGNALGAFVAAACAGDLAPSKYWVYRTLIFARRDIWMKAYPPEPYFLKLADSLGVDSVGLKRCVEARGSKISADGNALAAIAGKNGIYYTPAWSLADSVFVTEEIASRLQKSHLIAR